MKYKEEEDEISSFKGELSIVSEEKLKDGDSITLKNMELLLSKAKTSICEIVEENGSVSASGFICNIKYEENLLYCLITNYHAIREFI